MIQSVLPVAIFSNQNSTITMKGGTDVSFAPSMDYVKIVMQILPNCQLKFLILFTDVCLSHKLCIAGFISHLQAIWHSL